MCIMSMFDVAAGCCSVWTFCQVKWTLTDIPCSGNSEQWTLRRDPVDLSSRRGPVSGTHNWVCVSIWVGLLIRVWFCFSQKKPQMAPCRMKTGHSTWRSVTSLMRPRKGERPTHTQTHAHRSCWWLTATLADSFRADWLGMCCSSVVLQQSWVLTVPLGLFTADVEKHKKSELLSKEECLQLVLFAQWNSVRSKTIVFHLM